MENEFKQNFKLKWRIKNTNCTLYVMSEINLLCGNKNECLFPLTSEKKLEIVINFYMTL
jgi:hypothetical protein